MLQTMRHHAKYFYVLFFIVILTFIFWGVGTVDKSGTTGANIAEVEMFRISAEEYWRAYDRTYSFYRDLYKEKFDEEMQKKLKLKDNVLNTLIEQRVLLALAAKNGITVSDDELSEAIRSEPMFMNNGAFDPGIYQNRLRLNRLTTEAYESAKRQDLTASKMRKMIELAVIPSDAAASKLSGDDQTVKALRDAIAATEKDKAVKSYVEAAKKSMRIKINSELM